MQIWVQSFSPADWDCSEFCRQRSLWDWKLCPKLSWNDMLYPLAFGWYFKLRKLYCGLSLKLIWEFNLRWQLTIVSNLSVEVSNSERSPKTLATDTFLSFGLSFDDWKIELTMSFKCRVWTDPNWWKTLSHGCFLTDETNCRFNIRNF